MTDKQQNDVQVGAHIKNGRAVDSYTQKRNMSISVPAAQPQRRPASAQEIANDTVSTRPSIMNLGGQPLPHVIRSDTPDELTEYALHAVTCDSRSRTAVKKLMVQACENKYGTNMFRAVARKTHLDGVSVIWTEISPNANPEAADALNKQLEEEVNGKLAAVFEHGD